MKKAIPTFYEKPILGAFDVLKDDYLGHNTSILLDEFGVHEDTTGGRNEVPLGLVRHSDKVELVEKNGQKWISLSAALWVNYSYRQVKKLLKSKGKKVSVEVEVTKYHMDENNIEVIDEFSLMGITILGSDYTEAIPNANISIPELMETESYQQQKKSLTFAYQELDKSLGVTPESSDNTIENFSDTPINNEDTEEITMDNNNERGGETVPMFTMEEKKQILRDVIGKSDGHYVYILDLSDDEVFYEDDEGTFVAPYTITIAEDGKAVASVDESAKAPIMCTWKKYSENENPEAEKENFEEKEVEAEDNKENESEDEKKEDEAAEGECKLSEDECKLSEEEKKEDNASEEEKKEDNASEEECKLSEGEPCECESAEKCDDGEPCECASEESADEKKEEETDTEPEAECKMAEEENPENECKMSEDDRDDVKDDTDEDDSDDKEENSAEGEPCECALTFTVGEKTYSADEFKAEFEAMSAKVAEYEAKIAEYEAQFAQAKNSEIYTYVCSVIDSEEDLTAENKEIIKNAMKENCDKSTYSANDEAQEATEHLIADALYQQKKMSKNAKSEKDFSVSIVKETSTVVANNSGLEGLKDAIANLQKI